MGSSTGQSSRQTPSLPLQGPFDTIATLGMGILNLGFPIQLPKKRALPSNDHFFRRTGVNSHTLRSHLARYAHLLVEWFETMDGSEETPSRIKS